MTTNITNLRKAGRLNDAYQIANKNLQSDPTDIWNIRNMAWVLYDFAKQKATAQSKSQFLHCIEKIIELNVPADEEMFHQSVGFLIRAMAATLIRANDEDNNFFNSLFDNIKHLKIKPQSSAYSSIMQTFLRTKNWWTGFADFCRWWRFDSFADEDYQPVQTGDGQKIMPLAERVYMAYAKCLLDNGTTSEIDTFLPLIEQTYKAHSNYIYLPFYEAKLMLKIGRKEEFFNLMKSFAQHKRNEFWVWDLLGDYFDDGSTRLTFYAKALSCPSKPEMSIKLREKTAFLLCQLGYLAEALSELYFIIKIRERNKWNITPMLTQKIVELENQRITTVQSNKSFFANLAVDAEKLIFGAPKPQANFEGKIIVTNSGFGFVKFDKKDIFIPAKLISNNKIQNGDIVCGRYNSTIDKKKNKEGFAAVSIKIKSK